MGALQDDLALALELADVADGVTVAAFRSRDLVVETKPDLTPVTAADRGVEEEPIHVSSVAALGDAQLSFSGVNSWDEIGRLDQLLGLAGKCWRTRGFGDFWSHVLVAEGACDIGLDPIVSLWDLAALQVIVEEAGGRFTDLAGVAQADRGSAVSTNGLLHADVLALLNPDG